MPSKKWSDEEDEDISEDEFLAGRKKGKLVSGFVKGTGHGAKDPCPACGTRLQDGWCYKCRREMGR